MNIPSYIVFLVLLLNLVACAEQKRVMDYFPDAVGSGDQYRVWPAPPQIPRYRYAGQLRGELNFGPDEQSRVSSAEKISW